MHVEVMSPLMGEAVKHIVQHDRMSDSCEPGQWVYGSSASNISETCVAEPRDFSRWVYQSYSVTLKASNGDTENVYITLQPGESTTETVFERFGEDADSMSEANITVDNISMY